MTLQSSNPRLDSFGISAQWGFLSDEAPLTSFPNSFYAPWDDLIRDLPSLITSRTLTTRVNALPRLTTLELSSDVELRRAYVVLGFIIHAHPFLEVCDKLGMEPVLSYAGLCLWNWSSDEGTFPTADGDGFFPLEQLRSVASFMRTRGEDAFYHVPVLVEAEGGPLVKILLDAVGETRRSNSAPVQAALSASAAIIAKMVKHLPKLYATLDAGEFFHELRPYLAGGKGMEAKGLSDGFVFQRSDGSQLPSKHIGGSAAQSSLFQFLDLVLGVEHEAPEKASETVFQEMRAYMPRKHREFLEAVSQLPTLRSFVEARSSDAGLCEAFDECTKQLRLWRSTHIAIVSKYVVRPAREAARGSESSTAQRTEGADFEAAEGDEQLKGTGGSALIPFLKQSRDETTGVTRP
uniref:Indoleamine 2,3-dioxygenase n=1 Tax=Bionectria ochroleuca TaxID=29856 RepID=A0A0B7JZA0_BIOOC